MFSALKALLRKPPTIIGISVALAFQLIFSLVWMTAYDGMNERTDKLTVAIVNEDGEAGKAIGEQLAGKLPFHLENMSAEEAKDGLTKRDVQMVVTIPATFSEQLQTAGGKPELSFTINESNPATIKSIMQSAANSIGSALNQNVTLQGTEAVLQQLKLPEQQAHKVAESLSGRVAIKTELLNPVDGMNNQMVPMMLVLASFVGSMIMAMNVQQGFGMLGAAFSKWQKFGARIILNAATAVVVSLVGSSMVMALGGQAAHGMLELWMFQALFLVSFMFLAQMFIMLVGPAGMFLNMFMMSIQLVTSGAMAPRQMLNSFYGFLGEILPASYAVDGLMNLQFGGPAVGRQAAMLALITAICLLVCLVITALRRSKPALQAASVPEPEPEAA
ncbi:ABC transporter [Paenibacillus sp. CAA11]|uniref:YhgE/Pip domain-containing protein n=1 Tax=Paenibacillus sp. CAA11 TaxID=1532905 RepID=UPI000D37F01C|nr:ABC transporter permease [Paenibacillus sp. CAA11]AWB43194.1 ABC transporter [Paenibacillus sp. CAA11]